MAATDFRTMRFGRLCVLVALLAAGGLACATPGPDADDPSGLSTWLPTGVRITPQAASGAMFQALNPDLEAFPNFAAGQATSTALSPDGSTLLILTSGYNVLYDANARPIPGASNQYVFVYDVSARTPVKKQVLTLANTNAGIVFAPDGTRFFVSGGVDDVVHAFSRNHEAWREDGTPIALHHVKGEGIAQRPLAAGLAISGDGHKLLVANAYSDSISIIDLDSREVTAELDLRPGKIRRADAGLPGGEYPFWIAVKGEHTAFVSSQRDREIDVVDFASTSRLVRRIKVSGNPNKITLNSAQNLLFVACDNSDSVVVIDTDTYTVREKIATLAPASIGARTVFRGAAPNDVALAPDEKTLYVTNGGMNALAVIPLTGPAPHRVQSLLPTGWYPNAVSVGRRNPMLYVVNGRSAGGANREFCSDNDFDAERMAHCKAGNRYALQLEKAGFLAEPIPDARDLEHLTRTVAANNHLHVRPDSRGTAVMRELRRRIKHVIYIVRENRSYDQVLGDLDRGNGDPTLVEFGQALTPNQHALARQFVALDNFYDAGTVSGNGWPWSTAARESDVGVKTIPMYYAKIRGGSYDVEGKNRGVNVALPTVDERRAADPASPDDPDLLPGTADVAAPDDRFGEAGRGYLWDAALRAHLSVRNYGFFLDLVRYEQRKHPSPIALERDPAAARLIVAYPTNRTLGSRTDPYFRGFDNRFPDFYREREWEREFDRFVAHGDLPNLTLLRLMHDHLGDFGEAIDGVDTPETQVADNDYAVGRVVEKISRSRYKDSTLDLHNRRRCTRRSGSCRCPSQHRLRRRLVREARCGRVGAVFHGQHVTYDRRRSGN